MAYGRVAAATALLCISLLCYPILILSDYYTRSEAPRKIDYLLVTAEVNYM